MDALEIIMWAQKATYHVFSFIYVEAISKMIMMMMMMMMMIGHKYKWEISGRRQRESRRYQRLKKIKVRYTYM
jgi:hypothetical protein